MPPANFLLIIGAMKCGTTFLYNLLTQHPCIAACDKKEPDFFGGAPGYETWTQRMGYYRRLWSSWNPDCHRYALEASTNYTKIPTFPNAAERIATIADANFRFIYIVRDPIERIRSHLQYMTVYRRRLRLGSYRIETGEVPLHALEITQYACQISEYYERFPHEHIRIILFEELVHNPVATCQRLFQFLDIEPIEINPQLEHNETRAITFKSWTFALRRLIPVRQSLRPLVPLFLKPLLQDSQLMTFQLSTEQKHFILDFLREDLICLRDEYQVEIGRWNLAF